MESVDIIMKRLEIYNSTFDRLNREPNIIHKSNSELIKIRSCDQMIDNQFRKGKTREEVANSTRVNLAMMYMANLRAKLQDTINAYEGDLSSLKAIEPEIKGFQEKLLDAMVKEGTENVFQYKRYAEQVAQKLEYLINRKKHDIRLMTRNVDAIDTATNKVTEEKKEDKVEEQGMTF